MTPRIPRKLTILDGMILVAAVAGGFSLRRLADDAIATHGFMVYFHVGSPLDRIIEEVFPFLVTLTPAVLVMSLRRPRPRWRQVARQPGMAASCAAIPPIAMASIGMYNMANFMDRPEWYLPAGMEAKIIYGISSPLPPLGEIYGTYGSVIGLWVLGAWLLMAVGGWWRAERSGIDRLGRAFGAAWIVSMVVGFIAGFMG
jgi:hypothetical protein